jgi:hypothetical protein
VGTGAERPLLAADGVEALEDALVEVLERDTIHVGAVRQMLDRRESGALSSLDESYPDAGRAIESRGRWS